MFSRRWFIFGLASGCLLIAMAILLSVLRNSPDISASHPNESPVSSDATKSKNPVKSLRAFTEDKWAIRWKALLAQPEGESRDKAMEALLEELAAIDPMRAIELADRQTNSELRTTLLQAAMRGWGVANPEDAVAWAKTQTLMDEGQALASVFQGAARDPENALRLAAQLSAQEPERAGDYGSYLVAAFNRAGKFDRAAAFATDAPAEFRMDMLNAAYAGWASGQPQTALDQIAQLTDPEIKRSAFDAALSRWAMNDAKAATEFALTLPAGREQTFALSVALRNWSATDPAEAATWMSRFEPSVELDFGVATLATGPEALKQPEIATGWAGSIVDPRLRARVIASVVMEWAATDPVAARAYAENSPNIRPEDRATVLSAFDPDFSPISLLP